MLPSASDKNETNTDRGWPRNHYLISAATLHISISHAHSTNKNLKVHLSKKFYQMTNYEHLSMSTL